MTPLTAEELDRALGSLPEESIRHEFVGQGEPELWVHYEDLRAVLAAARATTEPGVDAAWREAEAAADALAPGIGAVAVSRWSWNTPEPFRATWRTEEGNGSTPAAALRALAAALVTPPAGTEETTT